MIYDHSSHLLTSFKETFTADAVPIWQRILNNGNKLLYYNQTLFPLSLLSAYDKTIVTIFLLFCFV